MILVGPFVVLALLGAFVAASASSKKSKLLGFILLLGSFTVIVIVGGLMLFGPTYTSP